ncbi:MAG: S-layer homology domain-containing protein [Acidimicrobiia bacterium]|nr:S-layer homology domain-containing protein [Acidimicrobiia bacterium]
MARLPDLPLFSGIERSSQMAMTTPDVPAKQRRRLVTTLLAAVALLAVGVGVPSGPIAGADEPGISGPIDDGDWLAWVNLYRAQTGLAPVVEDPALSAGAGLHAQWMLANQFASHPQCKEAAPTPTTCTPVDNPFTGLPTLGSTYEGHRAGTESNIQLWGPTIPAPRTVLERWMAGPFHAVGVIDPRLQTTGYGQSINLSLPLTHAAGLNILTGRAGAPPPATVFPLVWPGDGSASAVRVMPTEYPNPMTHCGWDFPAGAPVIVQYETPTPLASATIWQVNGDGSEEEIEACGFDGTEGANGYSSPDSDEQSLGRLVLRVRNAVVLQPRHPLEVGATFRYEIKGVGEPLIEGTFSVVDPENVYGPPHPTTTTTTTSTTQPAGGGPFTDVGANHPFVDAITWMVDEEIASGFADDTFRPTNPVSRQAMASFLWKLQGSPQASCNGSFTDVPPTHPFFDAICWMVAADLAGGYADGSFRPTNPVSRQAVAAFLHRLAGEPAPSAGTDAFSDVPPGHPFRTAIGWLVQEGIAKGFNDDTFRPTNPVSRQAAASFLYGTTGTA